MVELTVPKLMKAVVCREGGKPLQVEDVEVPTPKPRELLVKVKAASLCQSDLSIVNGVYGNSLFPLIPGHEAISVVVAIGSEAGNYGIGLGDLVGAPLWHGMCLKCQNCRLNRTVSCSSIQCKGIQIDGYFCEYTVIDAVSTVVITQDFGVDTPLGETSARLSPIFCAGSTVFDAFDHAKLGIGETLVVVGAGGLGQLAIAYASAFRAKIIALDVLDPQLNACKEAYPGLETINTAKMSGADLAVELKRMNSGSLATCVIVVSGAKGAYDSATQVLGHGGRLVVVGLPHQPLEFSATSIAMSQWKITGARVPDAATSARCLAFSQRCSVYPRVHPRRFKLEDFNEMVTLLNAGKVEQGRMVIYFD